MDSPFALEWTIETIVFGHVRTIRGHDFYDSLEEMRNQAEKLKGEPKVQQITCYQRKNGSLQVMTEQDTTGILQEKKGEYDE